MHTSVHTFPCAGGSRHIGGLDQTGHCQPRHVGNVGVGEAAVTAQCEHGGDALQERLMRACLSNPHALQLLGEHGSTRQNYPDFGELARLRIDLYRPAMLFDNDVVTNG